MACGRGTCEPARGGRVNPLDAPRSSQTGLYCTLACLTPGGASSAFFPLESNCLR